MTEKHELDKELQNQVKRVRVYLDGLKEDLEGVKAGLKILESAVISLERKVKELSS